MQIISQNKINKANHIFSNYFFAILFGFFFVTNILHLHFIFTPIFLLTFILLNTLLVSYESGKFSISEVLQIFKKLPDAYISWTLLVGSIYIFLYAIINSSFSHLIPIYFLIVPILALICFKIQSIQKQFLIVILFYFVDIFILSESLSRPLGIFGSPNASAITLTLLAFLTYLHTRKIYYLLIIIPFLIVFKSASSLLIYIYFFYYAVTNSVNWKFRLMINCSTIIFLSVMIYLFFPREADILRLSNYREAFQLIVNYPLSVNDALSASSFPTYFFPGEYSYNLENSFFNLIFIFGVFALPLIFFHFILSIKTLYFVHLVILVVSPLLASPDFVFIYYLLSITILNHKNKSDNNLNSNI